MVLSVWHFVWKQFNRSWTLWKQLTVTLLFTIHSVWEEELSKGLAVTPASLWNAVQPTMARNQPECLPCRHKYYTKVKVWMIFQPYLSVFRSFSYSLPHSWGLDRWINSDSTGHHPPQAAPSGQVSSYFPCSTARITHFLTIKPSQIYCQVIIYMEASQSEADLPFSSFSRPQICRRQVLSRGKQLHPCDQSWGNPFGL